MVSVSLYSVLILCISLVRNEATEVSFDTPPQFEFIYLMEQGFDIRNESNIFFKVQTCGNASIAFYEQHNPPIIKDYFLITAPSDCNKTRSYGMLWSKQIIQLVAGDSNRIITMLGLENRSVNYLAVATGYGYPGTWMFGRSSTVTSNNMQAGPPPNMPITSLSPETSNSLMTSSFIDHSPIITSYMGQYSVDDSESDDVGKTTQDQVYMTSMAGSNIMTSSSDMYAITSSTDFVMTSSDTNVGGCITSSSETTTEAEQCDLLCRCVGNGELNLNMSMAVVEIKKKLFINVSQLSKTVRKKISVVDNRPSSVSVGVFGIAILVSTFFLITVPDIFSVVVYFYLKF